MREAYFHEDDYCQTELLPVASYKHCRGQLGEIESFSSQRESELGWTDMFMRGEPSTTTLAATGIPRHALREQLIQFLPPFDRVTTGYSTYKEECVDTFAFGANRNLILFGEHGAEHVTKLWLTIYGLSGHDTELAARMFRLLSQWELLIVDWSMSAIVALNDVDAVGQYLAEFRAADNT